MSRRTPRWELEERRNARMRELRDQRESPLRRKRRLQPVVLLAWFAAVIAVLGIVLFVGFLAFAPRLMAWVEENPGAIEHGIVRDFVNWYEPEALSDAPASDQRRRVTVTIETGLTDAEIGALLVDAGVVHSELAFQNAVLEAGREGTLAGGTYDFLTTLRPSEIVARLQGVAVATVDVRIPEATRIEEITAALGESDLSMNLEQFAQLAKAPPADILNAYDFFADLPAGRSLEGYLRPDTYNMEAGLNATEVLVFLLNQFEAKLTPEMRAAFEAKGLTIDQAVIIASIVEREAVLEEERPLIAAVYINRILNPENGETNGILNADPTLQYGLATAEHGAAPVDEWAGIDWWPPLQVAGRDVVLPEELAGYQTYQNAGLPPSPIAAPRTSSLQAVADANLADGYLYFVAGCPGGVRDGSHYFSRTNAEHEANIAKANEECAAA